MQIPDKLPWAKEEKPAAVNHILAVWTEAVHSQSGQAAQRGFGGRLIFFDAAEQPLEVKGKLTIFVFDDQTGNVQETPRPNTSLSFRPKYCPNTSANLIWGHPIAFGFRWPRPVRRPSIFSLVAKFESDQGETVLSSLTKKVMVGSGIGKDKRQSSEPASVSGVQPASYREFESSPGSEFDSWFQRSLIRTRIGE